MYSLRYVSTEIIPQGGGEPVATVPVPEGTPAPKNTNEIAIPRELKEVPTRFIEAEQTAFNTAKSFAGDLVTKLSEVSKTVPVAYKGDPQHPSKEGYTSSEAREAFKTVPAMIETWKTLFAHMEATKYAVKNFDAYTYDPKLHPVPVLPPITGDTPEGHEWTPSGPPTI